MTTMQVGKRLVQLCKVGKFKEAKDELYSENIVSIEAVAMPGQSPRAEGIAAVTEKGRMFQRANEVHGCEITGPFPHGDRFIVTFKLDVTSKTGPMAGKRHVMEEAGLYTAKDGKIVHEEFFYPGMPD